MYNTPTKQFILEKKNVQPSVAIIVGELDWKEQFRKNIDVKFNALKKYSIGDTVAIAVSRASQTPFTYQILVATSRPS